MAENNTVGAIQNSELTSDETSDEYINYMAISSFLILIAILVFITVHLIRKHYLKHPHNIDIGDVVDLKKTSNYVCKSKSKRKKKAKK
jgi:hypothetical protein